PHLTVPVIEVHRARHRVVSHHPRWEHAVPLLPNVPLLDRQIDQLRRERRRQYADPDPVRQPHRRSLSNTNHARYSTRRVTKLVALVQGRPVIDGIAGACSDLAPAPSVDIANGAPTGSDPIDRMVMTYVSGALAQPPVLFTESANHGASWSAPRAVQVGGGEGLPHR